jgi:peptide/nickel transport system substrate-binding protein
MVVASLVGLAVVAAACGSSKSKSADTTVANATTAASAATATTAGATATTVAATTAAPTTVAAAPTPGGKLIMGIENDSAQPWTPANVQCAASCHQTIRSVYDPLALINDKGGIEPYLAKSITPNADSTVWTIVARDGVKFHDGTAFDGAAIADNLSRQRKSVLTGTALLDVTDVTVKDPMTVEVTMKRSWVAFPVYLVGQIGYMASPTWLKAVDADATQATKPVGTGPFIFESYTPNESFKAKKNPDYWNKPYPFVDEVEFRPIQDALARQRALESGDINVMHSTNGQSIKDFRDKLKDKFPTLEVTNFAETSYTMLYATHADVLADSRIRCALANSRDMPALIDKIQLGVNKIATGPFSPGQLGNLEDSGYPVKQDLTKAKALVADYKKEHPGKITIGVATTNDETNLTIAQAEKAWWEAAGIDEVTINQFEQGTLITNALFGTFQAFLWRNHGGVDLDAQYIWWHSSNAKPDGELALNFGRIKDPVIDKALDDNRGAKDPAVKKTLAETVNKQFAKECYNLWDYYTAWTLPHIPSIQGLDAFTLPSGNKAALGAGIAGTFNINGVFIKK